MGEAKRRQNRPLRPYKMIQGGETGMARPAGDPATWLKHYLRTTQRITNGDPTAATKVPCGTCQSCCFHKRVEVREGDDLAHLDTEPDPETGGLKLRKRADGGCIHLGPKGCSVYEHRPAVCRQYDCRAYSLIGMVVKYPDAIGNTHNAPVWNFGVPRTRDEKIFLLALRLAVVRHMRDNPDWNADTALRAALTNWREERDTATQMFAEFEELTPAQQRTFGEARP